MHLRQLDTILFGHQLTTKKSADQHQIVKKSADRRKVHSPPDQYVALIRIRIHMSAETETEEIDMLCETDESNPQLAEQHGFVHFNMSYLSNRTYNGAKTFPPTTWLSW